jgi:antitoxin FitA
LEQFMTVLTVRNLDPDVKTRLRVQAAQQGIAMEEAVRRILTRAANEPAAPASMNDLGKRIQARFAGLGEIEIPPRRPMRASPFSNDATSA